MKAKKRMPTVVTTSLTLSRSLDQSKGEGVDEACVKGSIRRTQTLLERKAHRTSVMRTMEGAVGAAIAVAEAAAEVAEEAMEITIRVVVAMGEVAMEITTGVAVATAGVVEVEQELLNTFRWIVDHCEMRFARQRMPAWAVPMH